MDRRLTIGWWCVLALLGGLHAGCAGIAQPSELRPASHPLLEGVAPRTRLLPLSRKASSRVTTTRKKPRAADAAPTRSTGPSRSASRPPNSQPSPRAGETRARIIERLDGLLEAREVDGRSASDMRFLRAVFDDVSSAARPGSTISSARRASRPVSRPRPGDVAFFDGAGGAAEVAVVRTIRDDGAVEAVAVTRGAIRAIVVHPDDPHARRRAGRIVNTFLRTRRPDDESSAVYLAGQLFIDFRTLID